MYSNPSKSHKDLSGVLTINSLVVPVKVGVTEAERKKPQNISVDIKIQFARLPVGCDTDNINDTVCYDSLCSEIMTFLKGGEFKLIEKIAADIYKIIEKNGEFLNILVSVKKKPLIDGLEGFVAMDLSGV